MTFAGSDYTLVVLMCLSMTMLTVTLMVEYKTSKNISKTKQLLAPCQITWQNSSNNLVFVAVPMGVLMACKLKIWWELGAIGLMPISENVFQMAIYAMKSLWQQHYVIVLLSFICTCLQLLLVDLCHNSTPFPWRFVIYGSIQIGLEMIQYFYVCFINPDSNPLQQGGGFSTFKSAVIILMDLFGVWSNLLYIGAMDTMGLEKDFPFLFDILSSLAVWGLFLLSCFLQRMFPAWRLWSANEMHSISEITQP
jgi:hypothetical protein